MEVYIGDIQVHARAWAIKQEGKTGLTVYFEDADGLSHEVILYSAELNKLATYANMLEMGISIEGSTIIESVPFLQRARDPDDICCSSWNRCSICCSDEVFACPCGECDEDEDYDNGTAEREDLS